MHASTEQLLEISDGFQNDASSHLIDCEYCQAELQALQSLSQKLFTSADKHPKAGIWDNLLNARNERLPDTSRHDVPISLIAANSVKPWSFNSLNSAIYTLAASILVTGLIGLSIYGQQDASRQQTELLQASIQELMLNSRGMEQVLQKVALQNDMLSSTEQTLAERLYWRLTYVDQMINENSQDNHNDPKRTQALWNSRIDTLAELSQLYYQRKNTLDDSEI